MRKLLAALAIVGGLSLSSIVPAEAHVIVHHRTVHVIRHGRRGPHTVVIHHYHVMR